jgi:hypothetical protein
MTNIDALKSQLKNLTVRAALLCVEQRAPNKVFLWGGQMWTPKQAGVEWEPELMHQSCAEFGVVRFFGGPPKDAQWYDGTILSMLCDLILFEESTKGWSNSEKIASYA